MKGNLMATKKTPHLSRKQRKAFIAAMLDRFIPKMQSPFAQMGTAHLSLTGH